MNKFGKCRLGLAGTLLLGLCIITAAAVKQSSIVAVISFLVMGLLGAVLSAQYKIETYRVIGEQSPGAYERILKEGEFPEQGRPPLPESVETLLKQNRRFQHFAAWLPVLEMVLFFGVQIITRKG